jgi:excisionase family DNA binding protein
MRVAPAEPVFRIDELSRYLKISESTLYKLAQVGSLPGQKAGKHWGFHRDAIDEWLKRTSPPTQADKK